MSCTIAGQVVLELSGRRQPRRTSGADHLGHESGTANYFVIQSNCHNRLVGRAMNEPRTVFDAEGSPTAADAMAIIERQQARTSSQLRPNGAVFYALWGVIWLAIGVLYFLVAQIGLADGIAGWSTAVLVIGGMVISAVVGLRSGRGVGGPSSVQTTR